MSDNPYAPPLADVKPPKRAKVPIGKWIKYGIAGVLTVWCVGKVTGVLEFQPHDLFTVCGAVVIIRILTK